MWHKQYFHLYIYKVFTWRRAEKLAGNAEKTDHLNIFPRKTNQKIFFWMNPSEVSPSENVFVVWLHNQLHGVKSSSLPHASHPPIVGGVPLKAHRGQRCTEMRGSLVSSASSWSPKRGVKTAALLTEKSSWGRGRAGGGPEGGHSVQGCGCSPEGRSGSGGPRGGRGQASSDALRMRGHIHESIAFIHPSWCVWDAERSVFIGWCSVCLVRMRHKLLTWFKNL